MCPSRRTTHWHDPEHWTSGDSQVVDEMKTLADDHTTSLVVSPLSEQYDPDAQHEGQPYSQIVDMLLVDPSLIDGYSQDLASSIVHLIEENVMMNHSVDDSTWMKNYCERLVEKRDDMSRRVATLCEVSSRAAARGEAYVAEKANLRSEHLEELNDVITNLAVACQKRLGAEQLFEIADDTMNAWRDPAEYTKNDLTVIKRTEEVDIGPYMFSSRLVTSHYIVRPEKKHISRLQKPVSMFDKALLRFDKSTNNSSESDWVSYLAPAAEFGSFIMMICLVFYITNSPMCLFAGPAMLLFWWTMYHFAEKRADRLKVEMKTEQDAVLENAVNSSIVPLIFDKIKVPRLDIEQFERGVKLLKQENEDRDIDRDAIVFKNTVRPVVKSHLMTMTRAWLIEALPLIEAVFPHHAQGDQKHAVENMSNEEVRAFTLLATKYEKMLVDPIAEQRLAAEEIEKRNIVMKLENKKKSAISTVLRRYEDLDG